MTPEQKAAFDRHKREQNKAERARWRAVTGDRTPEQLKKELDELAALAQRLGLGAPGFEMTGTHRPLDEVAAAIRDAHIGLVPGRDDHEDSVLPTKLLEYMAVGIPTVATRTRTVSRFFDERHTELVPEGDVDAMAQALVRLARDKDRRKALTAGGWAWQEEYGWEVQKGLLFRTFDAVAADKAAAARRKAQAAVDGVKTGTRREVSNP
ncbi:MAG: glycosyltransferase family 4 protein [Myxococcales bacterium]|nr:glycosyltransferase family 4 protein [Myxococcales bacterium]